jgi:8-oxo-dGTP diphosphatase
MSHTNQKIKVAVDAVVFGYENQVLHVLLIQQRYGQMKDRWALPGGFVLNNETLRDAVKRELKEETGVSTSHLEQLYTFGDDVNRDSRAQVISVSYFGVVRPNALKLKASGDAQDARWFRLDETPDLAFDHNRILKVALQRLRAQMHYQPIGFSLLKREFPFSDLENLYSTILGYDIERRNFRKRMLALEIVEETDKKVSIGRGRPAFLFKFNKAKYDALKKSGAILNLHLA